MALQHGGANKIAPIVVSEMLSLVISLRYTAWNSPLSQSSPHRPMITHILILSHTLGTIYKGQLAYKPVCLWDVG